MAIQRSVGRPTVSWIATSPCGLLAMTALTSNSQAPIQLNSGVTTARTIRRKGLKTLIRARDREGPPRPASAGEGWGEGPGRLAADARQAPHPNLLPAIPGSSPGREKGPSPTPEVRPEILAQSLEKVEIRARDREGPPRLASAGRGLGRGAGATGRRRSPSPSSYPSPRYPRVRPGEGEEPIGVRPEILAQCLEKVKSAPGIGAAPEAGGDRDPVLDDRAGCKGVPADLVPPSDLALPPGLVLSSDLALSLSKGEVA